MITKCPECELPVSSHAAACPHCGYPMKSTAKRKRKTRRRRLPNGFGQITEIKGQNLRKPFRAMVTVGKTPEGKPISKLLKPEAYFETYNDAYQALVKYSQNPYQIDPGITVKELYKRWIEARTAKGVATRSPITGAWPYCEPLYEMRVSDLRTYHIKELIEHAEKTVKGETIKPDIAAKQRIKSLFNLMLDYAVEYELVPQNCARNFSITATSSERKAKKPHITFSANEMNILWQNLGAVPYVDAILVQCYSGWRPQELCLLEIQNVDLKNMQITGGMKTEAGENRIVPIHSKIQPIVRSMYEKASTNGSKYLVSNEAGTNGISPRRYEYVFEKISRKLGLNPDHRPHDPRVFFVTEAKEGHADEYAIKRMIGHKINDITEAVYTKRDPNWLREEIEKIK